MKQNFIKTSDKETATKLKNLGLQEVNNSEGIYLFVNPDKILFDSDIDQSKLHFTNILTF